MAGRKPKPTAVKEAEGNPGRRDLPGEPNFEEIDDAPPMKLDAKAKKIWDRLFAQLKTAGVLKDTDTYILASFCVCQSKFEKFDAMNDRLNSLEYLKQARQLAASLGLSPTDRARLGLKPEKKKNALAEFEKRGDENRKGRILPMPRAASSE